MESGNHPNNVTGSNERKQPGAFLGKTRASKQDYTEKVSRANRVEPGNVGTMNNVAIESKNNVDIDKILKLVKLIGVGVVIAIVVVAATLGGIIVSQIKRIDNMERTVKSVQSDVATWQKRANNGTLVTDDVHDQAHTNISMPEFKQIKYQLDTLKSIVDTQGAALMHMETYTNYLETRIENNTYQIASAESRMMTESETLKFPVTAIEDTNETFTSHDILRTLNDSIMHLNVLTSELNKSSLVTDSKLSQTEAKMESFEAAIQDLTFRNFAVESKLIKTEIDIETDRGKIDFNSDRITHLEAFKTIENDDKVEMLSSNLTDLVISIWTINTTLQNTHAGVIENGDRIGMLNETQTALKMEIATVDIGVQNNQAELTEQGVKIGLLNESVAANMENAQNFGSNITDLEEKIGTIKDAIQNNYHKINSTVLGIEEMNGSISVLNTRLTNVAAFIPESYYVFSAYGVSVLTPSTGSTVVFANTWLNDNGVYSKTTGKFTAPCDGVYEFHAILTAGAVGKRIYVAFKTGMATAIGKFNIYDSSYYLSTSGSAIGWLQKGTQVYLFVESVDSGFKFAEGSTKYMNTFSGHLISKYKQSE